MTYLNHRMPIAPISVPYYPVLGQDETSCISDRRRLSMKDKKKVSSISDGLNVFAKREMTISREIVCRQLGEGMGNMGYIRPVHSATTDIDISNLRFGLIC